MAVHVCQLPRGGGAATLPSQLLEPPLACQPLATHPALPIFHIVGNVTQTDAANRSAIRLAPINDVSAVVEHMGVYHVFHQWQVAQTCSTQHAPPSSPPCVPGALVRHCSAASLLQ